MDIDDGTSAEQLEVVVLEMEQELQRKTHLLSELKSDLATLKSVATKPAEQTLRQREQQLNETILRISQRREQLTKLVASMRVEIKERVEKELSLNRDIQQVESALKESQLRSKTKELGSIYSESEQVRRDIQLKQAQLDAIEHELQSRDQSRKLSIGCLLQRAEHIQRELETGYYDSLEMEDLERKWCEHGEGKEGEGHLDDTAQHMIDKRLKRLADEKERLDLSTQQLYSDKVKLIQDMQDFQVRKQQILGYPSQRNYSESPRHKADQQSGFSGRTLSEVISTVKQDIPAQMRELSRLQECMVPDSRVFQPVSISRKSLRSVYPGVRDLLCREVINPFCELYIIEDNEMDQLEEHIEHYSRSLREQLFDIFKQREQSELMGLPGEIMLELLHETIYGMIQHIWADICGVHAFAAELMTSVLVSCVLSENELKNHDEVVDQTHNIFRQLQMERKLAEQTGPPRRRFSLRHPVLDLQSAQENEPAVVTSAGYAALVEEQNAEWKKRERQAEESEHKRQKRKGMLAAAFGGTKKNNVENNTEQRDYAELNEERKKLLRQKREFYRLEASDGIEIKWLSISKAPDIDMINRFSEIERVFWSRVDLANTAPNSHFSKVRYKGGGDSALQLHTEFKGVSTVTLSEDADNVLVASTDGHIAMFNIATAVCLARTRKQFALGIPIIQLVLAANEREILTLDRLFVVRVYRVLTHSDNADYSQYKHYVDGGYWSDLSLIQPLEIIPVFKLTAADFYRPATKVDSRNPPVLSPEQLDPLRPVTVGFHPCVMRDGKHPSILVGLSCGSIVKWNIDNPMLFNADVIYAPCIADDEPYFPFATPYSSIDDNEDTYIQREFFQGHSAAVLWMRGFDGTKEMLSVDAEGLVAYWRYQSESWTDYGWFEPTQMFRLDCDDFFYLRIEQEPPRVHYNSERPLSEPANEYMDRLDLSHFSYHKTLNNRAKPGCVNDLYTPLYTTDQVLNATEPVPVPVQCLTFDEQGQLKEHSTQMHSRVKLVGSLFGCYGCSNFKDIVVGLEMNSADASIPVRTASFRLLCFDDKSRNKAQDSARPLTLEISSFRVSVRLSLNDMLPECTVSPCVSPPGTDFLYVLHRFQLRVWSLLTGHCVMKHFSLPGFSMTNLCVAQDHSKLICTAFSEGHFFISGIHPKGLESDPTLETYDFSNERTERGNQNFLLRSNSTLSFSSESYIIGGGGQRDTLFSDDPRKFVIYNLCRGIVEQTIDQWWDSYWDVGHSSGNSTPVTLRSSERFDF